MLSSPSAQNPAAILCLSGSSRSKCSSLSRLKSCAKGMPRWPFRRASETTDGSRALRSETRRASCLAATSSSVSSLGASFADALLTASSSLFGDGSAAGVYDPGFMSSLRRHCGVDDIDRVACFPDARHRILVGHCRDCKSNRRGNEAIAVSLAGLMLSLTFRDVPDAFGVEGAIHGPMGGGEGPTSALHLTIVRPLQPQDKYNQTSS